VRLWQGWVHGYDIIFDRIELYPTTQVLHDIVGLPPNHVFHPVFV